MHRRSTLLFLGFCVLFASEWLLPQSSLSVAASLVLSAGSAGFVACVAAVALVSDEQRSSFRRAWSLRFACSSIGAVMLPAVLLLLGRQHSNGITEAAVQGSVPVIVAVTLNMSAEVGESLQGLLTPALVALAGLLLVLPVSLPHSTSGWVSFSSYLAAAGLSGVSSVACHREMVKRPFLQSFLVVACANTLFAFVVSCFCLLGDADAWRHVISIFSLAGAIGFVRSAIASAGLITLTFTMQPIALSTRFLFVPLFAATEAFLLLRPTLTFRAGSGALLIVAGAVTCLRHRTPVAGANRVFFR